MVDIVRPPKRRRTDRWADSPLLRAILVATVSAAIGWAGSALTTSLMLVGRVEAVEQGLSRVESRIARMEDLLTAGALQPAPRVGGPALRASTSLQAAQSTP